MNTAEITYDHVLDWARHLPPSEQAQLISQLAMTMKYSLASQETSNAPRQFLHEALADLGPTPSAEDIDERQREMWDDARQAREFARLTAPMEEAWKKSGLTEEDLPEILEQIRIEVTRRNFPDLFKDE